MLFSQLWHRDSMWAPHATWPQDSFHTHRAGGLHQLSFTYMYWDRSYLDPWCSWTHDRWISRQHSARLRAASEPLAVWMTSCAAAVWLITLITCLPCMWFQSQACPCSSSARCVKTAPTGGGSHSNKQNNNLRQPQLTVKPPCRQGSLV